MARIRQIQEIINSKLPSYNSAFTRVRGLAFPLDIFLRGRIRFGRKLGALLPVWIPDNATELAESVTTLQKKLVLVEAIPWLIPGSKIRLGSQVFAFVEDIVDDGLGIILSDFPITNFDFGSLVELYAHPLEMNAAYPGTPDDPVTNIRVLSDHKIYNGDAINVGTFDHEVVSANLVNVIDDGRFHYQLTLATGITTHLEEGRQNQAYLRAYPAYESDLLKVPTIPTTVINSIGPFLFDRVSGEFFTDMNVDEIDLITTYDTGGNPLQTRKMSKNTALYGASLSPDIFLFWDRVRGKIQWDNNKQAFKAITDSTGIFQLHEKCIPVLKPGQVTAWRVRVETTVDTKMVVELEPNDPQVFNIPAGTSTAVTVTFPGSSEPIEHIHILFDTGAAQNAAVYMMSWETNTPTVGFISHTTIAKVSGKFLWGSSGAFAKPYFLKLDYIKAKSDLYGKLDSGLISG